MGRPAGLYVGGGFVALALVAALIAWAMNMHLRPYLKEDDLWD